MPAGINILAGLTEQLLGLLEVIEMVTPPAGAGADRVIGIGPESPHWPTDANAGNTTCGALVTVTRAVTSGSVPAALACTTVEPGALPVTATVAEMLLAGTVTVPGTLATAGLSTLRFTVRPPLGAGEGSVKDRRPCDVPLTARLVGVKPTPAITTWLAEVRPDEDAVMVAEPKPTAVTVGGLYQVVAPG